MPGRIRNTEKLAQRVNRSYLKKKLFPIPLWRRILTAGCLTVALAWLGLYAATRNQTPYTAGPLSTPHAFLGRNCNTCHAEVAGMGKRVTDKQCGSCHDAPIHNVQQVSTPPCVECHQEHRGMARLTALNSRECAVCHADLKTKSGTLTVNAHIGSFDDHPQFRRCRPGTTRPESNSTTPNTPVNWGSPATHVIRQRTLRRAWRSPNRTATFHRAR